MSEKGVGYILGIISIVLAFMQPLAGLIFGVIGFKHAEKEKSKIAKRYNTIGIIISTIILVTVVIGTIYLKIKGIDLNSWSFPR